MGKRFLLLFSAVLCAAVCAANVKVKLNDGWEAVHSGNYEVKATADGFTAKQLKKGKPLVAVKKIKLPANSRLLFSSDVQTAYPATVKLEITQNDQAGLRDKHKPRTYASRDNFSGNDTLISESDIRNTEPVELKISITPVSRKNVVTTVSNIFAGNPSGNGEAVLEIAPAYVSAGYEISNLAASEISKFKAQAYYREEGGKFRKAFAPDYPPFEHKARGVLVNLKENTAYELKLEIDDNGKKSVLTKKFRTLGKDFPVKKTVYLTPEKIAKGFVVKESGTADGYIRYTAKPGVVLNSKGVDAIKINNVQYVILENLTLRGGLENSIRVTNSKNIVIRNCDIAKFGRVGIHKPHRGGEYYYKNRILNSDSGIWIKNAKDVLIERNFIHDANGFTNPWFYSHPTGPKAINAGMVENATVRFNDFVGGDVHRWNDAVECMGNSSTVGGFFRNAEIYGNLFALSNDDGIELEGGEINTRFFSNRIEATLCGVSSGSCVRGPSYIFNNLFWRGNDVFGLTFNSFKNGHGIWNSGKVHLFNNTATGYRNGTNGISVDPYRPRLDKMVNYNNIFALNNTMGSPRALFQIANCPSDYNLYFNPDGTQLAELRKVFKRDLNGVEGDPKFVDAAKGDFRTASASPARGAGKVIDNFTGASKVDIGAFQGDKAPALPLRDLSFMPDTGLVNFKSDFSAPKSVTLKTSCPKAKIPFVIAQTIESDWLTVTPSKGVITKDKPVTLTVKINPEKFTTARLNRTVFLVRTPEGLSRPVSVEADTRKDAALIKKNRKGVLYTNVVNSKKSTKFSFDVPAEGHYFVMFYGKVKNGVAGKVTVFCDGKKLYKTPLHGSYQMMVTARDNTPSYFCLANWTRKNIPVKLTKGKHNFEVKYDVAGYAPEGAALITSAEQLMYSCTVR